jgi:hypothetical protein
MNNVETNEPGIGLNPVNSKDETALPKDATTIDAVNPTGRLKVPKPMMPPMTVLLIIIKNLP